MTVQAPRLVASVLIKGLCVAVAVSTPVLGVWLATALVSFHGGPRGLALASGVLLFPVLPLAWEAYAVHRWRKKGGKKRRFLTGLDRLLLRTLGVNAAFLIALLSSHPKTAFAALATKGDWFIAEQRTPWASSLRRALVSATQGLEWLHELANPNPYRKDSDRRPLPKSVQPNDPRPPKAPVPPRGTPSAARPSDPSPQPGQDAATTPPTSPPPPPATERGHWAVGQTFWPFPSTVHPALAALAPEDEASPQALAKALAAREPDPFLRVKALHDWAVTRLRYDDASTAGAGARAAQDAASVFASRLGVCEGYARLLVELGKLTGDRIEYITGEVREENGELAPVGHAWNAVEIHGAWYLLDATWDDPRMRGGGGDDGAANYHTDYLFIPPSLAGLDHFPDEVAWQLRQDPLRRADFLRQPLARPSLAREGLTLVRPERPSVEVGDRLQVVLDNPLRRFVMLELDGEECAVDDAPRLDLHCQVRRRAQLKARLFANTRQHGTYQSVAAIDVAAR